LIGVPEKNYIEVCGKKCMISETDSTSTNSKCILPPISTIYSDTQFKITPESNDLKSFSIFGTGADESENQIAFDDDLTVAFTSESADCNIGVEFNEGYVGLISEVKYLYPTIPDKSKVADKVIFQGSNSGLTWIDIFTVTETVREGWNYHTIESSSDYLQYK